MNYAPDIITRWQAALASIEKLQQLSPTSAKKVALIAVSKGQPAASIEVLLAAGHKEFGENKVQEAMEKWPALKSRYPDARLHLIGSLQTNKVKDALSLFDVIHTIDRMALVDAIVKERCSLSVFRCSQFFIQVNTGEEPQKGGVMPDNLPLLLDYIRKTDNGERATVNITGLMCIPPAGKNPAPHFALLSTLARTYGPASLSMGMSSDYETAVRLGATHVRIGTALFGERK